uniref:HAUS augmin-like complex subunit 2 n=1 Tax=Urocitellus parryii TaxID=9999 RepID=A0A8D2HNZ4_UROPR
MAAANAWDPASAPNSAGLLLGHFVASGLVTQEMLNISKRTAPCFEKFSRLQQITNIQAEIYQKSLEIELLKLEKDAADVVHPFYLLSPLYPSTSLFMMGSCHVAHAGLQLLGLSFFFFFLYLGLNPGVLSH